MSSADVETAPLGVFKADTETFLSYSPFCNLDDQTSSTTTTTEPTSSKSPTLSESAEPSSDAPATIAAIPIKSRHESHLRETLATVVESGMMQDEHAFFLVDLGSVYRQHEQFNHELPMVKPFYAVKCNPDPMILKALASLGAGFDCASRAEIEAVISMGVLPDRIICKLVEACLCRADLLLSDRLSFDFALLSSTFCVC
jgi:ornithine decarboxylase